MLPAALGLLALLAINNNSSPIDALPGRRFTFIKHVPANLLLLYDSTVGRPFKNKPKCHQFGSVHYVYNNNEPSLVHTMLHFLYIAFKLDFCYCPSNYPAISHGNLMDSISVASIQVTNAYFPYHIEIHLVLTSSVIVF